MFDDGEPTHLQNAIPELQKRGLIGTFFLNPGAKWYNKDAWENEIPRTRMELANHSMHHTGATSVAEAEAELGGCQEILLRLYPERKIPRLIALSYPGGSPWMLSEEEKAVMQKKFNLLRRPVADAHVCGVHLNTPAEMIGMVDRALANGSMEYLIFHGVGGDWLSVSLEDFAQALDAVAANRDALWVTDPVSVHKYAVERDSAQIHTLEKTDSLIRLSLQAVDDPLYDEPLTLISSVPSTWTSCLLQQGERSKTLSITQSTITFEALPNGPEIILHDKG